MANQLSTRSASPFSQPSSFPDSFGLGDDQDDFGISHAAAKRAPTTAVRGTADDDLLGLLSQPVPPRTAIPAPIPRVVARAPSVTRSSSPPPHILGQIVEMGFSVAQARLALDATKRPSGDWNVEGALDVLVSQASQEEVVVQEEVLSPRPTGRRAREEAARAAAATREEPTSDRGAALLQYQEQANVLLSQASKFGFSALKSASTYYQTSRATLQKAVEEGLANHVDGGPRRGKEDPSKGRPRWMTEDVPHEPDGRGAVSSRRQTREEPKLLFVDSDTEDAPDPLPPRGAPAPSGSHAPILARRAPSPPRVRTPVPRASTSALPLPTAARPRAPSPSPSSSLPARPARTIVAATPAQLSTSLAHKTRGNALFKLGHFAESVLAYGLALEALPGGHLARVGLWNNRATARLKNGEDRLASEDASAAVSLILGGGASGELVWSEVGTDPVGEVDLVEGLAKALSRRARASEANERWREAAEDWETLMRGDELVCKAAGGRNSISEGLARARQMLLPLCRAPAPVKRPPPSLAAKPKSAAVAGAVAKLKSDNHAASAEDDLRFSLKDSVETSLLAWKGGKETNLRALIASLQNVLWAELGWVTVGLHELVSEGQVKVRYMRAIAKVHPDKVSYRFVALPPFRVGLR